MELRSEGFDSDQLAMCVMGHTIFPDECFNASPSQIPGCIIFGTIEMEPRLKVDVNFYSATKVYKDQVFKVLPDSVTDVGTFPVRYFDAYAGNPTLLSCYWHSFSPLCSCCSKRS
ncbi:unnamed protein product [Polarella glacialis]|uniref:Uncharacterized protein n=1 Tax=Polarella glacialis TaxID=89957 RepID=A0A813G3K5_POLGL|nr:unnamed protein product [Polarella glacialis]